MVTKKSETESKLTLKTLSIIAGLIFALLGALAGAFVYIDDKYVHQDIYAVHTEQNEKEHTSLDRKTAQLITAIQAANKIEMNKVYQAIKSASALPLIVRRDVLLSRENRTAAEDAELAIIRAKLSDLNIQ